jgi:hypothetical protein
MQITVPLFLLNIDALKKSLQKKTTIKSLNTLTINRLLLGFCLPQCSLTGFPPSYTGKKRSIVCPPKRYLSSRPCAAVRH